MFDRILLEPVQEELLIMLVEAARNVKREEREPFIHIELGEGTVLMHPGLNGKRISGVYRGDLEILGDERLLKLSYSPKQGNLLFDVTPLGFNYYARLKERVEQCVQGVETFNQQLHQLLVKHFNGSELKQLCFDLTIDYDELEGEGKGNKARELIKYAERRGTIEQLKDEIIRQRPNISMPKVLIEQTPASPRLTEIQVGNRLAGPLSTEFKHDEADGVEWYNSGALSKNFTVETDFITPYSASVHPWNAVIFFRDGYRVWVNSDNSWGYGRYDANSVWSGHDGILPEQILNLNANSRNHLKLVVQERKGCFYVNDRLVGSLDLAASEQAGNVFVGIDQTEPKIKGAITKFENFEVFADAPVNC